MPKRASACRLMADNRMGGAVLRRGGGKARHTGAPRGARERILSITIEQNQSSTVTFRRGENIRLAVDVAS